MRMYEKIIGVPIDRTLAWTPRLPPELKESVREEHPDGAFVKRGFKKRWFRHTSDSER
ncbi:hypothetical protein SERLA73DRAFT_181084 [Serpula lacrymans var. lacrymans S7.3]|uniref:Uncharacterized protein n=2 Tax=Serpula lacrymans var. lacrymans TaxID=341189 RepID=F8PUR6_SERL3|nr:uncharacterized protein SERLADRAFT_466968 [Serpula lacrymans var. lacrymans S7.9]EGO00474.1 hypothetical protein SERLA73DRAFT_181084 [Serpula lacrymans var. lacrymans S7.3]EGO26026.1 hypothetical protein SERLADRAFT_466968 [Serpula lacrymans var. lacrymans S7.9]